MDGQAVFNSFITAGFVILMIISVMLAIRLYVAKKTTTIAAPVSTGAAITKPASTTRPKPWDHYWFWPVVGGVGATIAGIATFFYGLPGLLATGVLYIAIYGSFKLDGKGAESITRGVVVIALITLIVGDDNVKGFVTGLRNSLSGPIYRMSLPPAPPGLRYVANEEIRIAKGGFDRFLGYGKIKVTNRASGVQCINATPDSRNVVYRTGNTFIVKELIGGQLIWELVWDDTPSYTLKIAPGRVEPVTLTAIPLGERDCRSSGL